MGLLRRGLLGFWVWIFLAQIRTSEAQGCSIVTSITSPSASSLFVYWTSYSGATNYVLDLRVVNASNVAPVVVTLSASTTQRQVFGLKPGTLYTVAVKVFRFYQVVCSDTRIAKTVPNTSQITSWRALSSTSISLDWEKVTSADNYFVLVSSALTGERYNFTFTTTTAQIKNLKATTSYDCYVVSANSAGMGAKSQVRTVTTLVQPPAVVTVEQSVAQAVRIKWQPVDRVLLYKVIVTDSKNTLLVNTTVSTTFLDVQNLLPCTTFQIGVASVNTFLEPGEFNLINHTTSTVNPVTFVTADYSCLTGTTTVNWGTVFGADYYEARATDQNGGRVSCSSRDTMCQLNNLSCGGDYSIQVSAFANNCESTNNAATSFQTVPCAPDNLQLYRECSSNVIIFSWQPTNNTAFYMAHTVDSTGYEQSCITSENLCYFTETVCGRNYSFSVYAVTGECSGPVSMPVNIQTAPCKPTNVITVSNCLTDIITTSWDTAAGAQTYVVEGSGNRGNSSTDDNFFTCSSKSNSCVVPYMTCGESLTIKVTAFDAQCSSEPALATEAYTAPCVPQNVSAVIDCSSDSVTLTWGMSLGALFYIAIAQDASGGQNTCNSVNLECQITGLQCGSTYSASVMSSNYFCNSSSSTAITVETAPCPPSQVQTLLDCEGNQAQVSWNLSPPPASYTAMMVDQSGGLLSCSSVGNSCWVPNLRCSQYYDVSVVYHKDVCSSKPSSPIRMKSVPCGPVNFQAWVDCSSSILQMTWTQAVDADGYRASVVSVDDGGQLFCNSTSPNCSLSSVMCGKSYSAQVQSYKKTCLSMPSSSVILKEVPCVPTSVMVESTCGNSTSVTWQASRGAQSYKVSAKSNCGHQRECSSNSTTCSLTQLHCGEVYNITVIAMDDLCSSLKSQSVTLPTVPCAPVNVHGVMNCSSNAVMLSWDISPNAVSFSASAVGADGHMLWCNSSSARCQLTDLHCGQDYTVRVHASDGMCVSPDSEIYTQSAAPCAPSAITNNVQCDTNTVSVTWVLSTTPLNYSALASPGMGAVLGCTSSSTGCDITRLQCGQTYTLSVTAANQVCEGPASALQIFQTAPCMPHSVKASVTCSTNTVVASWAPAAGALYYTGLLTAPDGSTTSCSTPSLFCSFSSLSCAQNFTVHVSSNNVLCRSPVSPDFSVTTGPCAPDRVIAELQCDTAMVNVSWVASAGASTYTILAYAPNQGLPSSSCTSSSTSCALKQLPCGTEFSVNVLAGDSACNSSSHASTTVKTAPCPPTLQTPLIGCISNQAVVSWTGAQDVSGVTVNAISSLGSSVVCSSANDRCTLQDLQCGQTYTVQATSQQLPCNSVSSSPISFVTVPCTPAAVQAVYTCGTSTAELSWDESLGRRSFVAKVQTQDHTDYCNSMQTHCSIPSLLCGRVYNVSVVSEAGDCNSSNSVSTQMETAPCAPQNVLVSLQCDNNTALVSWTASPNALSYKVSAVGSDGDTKFCSSSETTCQIPNMHCAQMYTIAVTPYMENCDTFPSSFINFTAGPCPPTGIQVSLGCNNNVGSVSWDASPNAKMYIATAQSTDGQMHNCTTSGTNCFFLDLECGKEYSVTLITMDRGCWSQPSSPVLLRSAVCPPAHLTGFAQCGTNDITIAWDSSPWSGVTYLLFSQQDGGSNSTYSSAAASYMLTGLQCGLLFTVQVAAQDNTCTSGYSSPVQIHTAPCPASHLTATAECGINQAALSWDMGKGALFYTSSLVSSEGHVVSCTSNTTSCTVKLECGQHYTATVTASTASCNSTASSSIDFDAAPCLTGGVQTQLNCTTNTVAIQWDATSGNPKSYMALAIGADGSRSSCNTSSTSCTIQNLSCGNTYGIAVIASTMQCNILGSDYTIQTAPCRAENLSVSLACESNIATVQWSTTGMNQLFKVSAVNSTGGATECLSPELTCTFDQFSCGETYTLTVSGVSSQCNSEPSYPMDLKTVPCVPTHVTANYDCTTSITSVKWDVSQSAENYMVYAVGSQGDTVTCSNTDTNCEFPSLSCGQDYAITVTAKQGGCESLPSSSITVSTAPCPYSNIHASLDCSGNSALVSWTLGEGILNYQASADALIVNDHVTCTTSSSSCNVTGLQCAQFYQISVSGQGYTCPSPSQVSVPLSTGPCPPNQVSAVPSCDSNIVKVSWTTSQGSLYYLAVAQSSEGQQFTCQSNGTSCAITGLQCGQTYEVYVSGVDETCKGPTSQVQMVNTVPCRPQNVQTVLECQSTVLNVSWERSGGAMNYLVVVETSSGEVIMGHSDTLYLTVPNILCGLTYSVSVMAQNGMCNSSRSSAQDAISAPCPLQTISADIDCASNTLSVSWPSRVPGVYYMVQAVSSEAYYTCNSTDTSCSISVPCGMSYSITVAPNQNGCTGAISTNQVILAAPCVPTVTNVKMDCLSDSALVRWQRSAGAESYRTVATDSGGHQYVCNSTDSLCPISGLECGKFYNFSLTAVNAQCSSAFSNTMQSETAPCPPQGVTVSLGCDSGTVTVNWLRSVGALTYTTTLVDNNGQSYSCSPLPNATTCDINSLPCGRTYVATVTAVGQNCNSSQSNVTTVQTAPCQPQGLNFSMSCTENIANVWWTASLDAQLYTVTAVSHDGTSLDTCSGFYGSCDLRSLMCGQQYTATVTAQHSTCLSQPSLPIHIKAVPCSPQNLVLEVDCLARNLTVSWTRSSGVEFYTATVLDTNGQSTTCQSLDDRCTISGLACGNIYHGSVIASDGYCSSPPCDVRDIDSVPCAPGNIYAQMDFQTGSAMLSWQMSAGAVRYTATAVSSSGQNVTCATTQTSCELLQLLCGETYSVFVQAVGSVCSSTSLMSGDLQTAPCVPEHVTVSYVPTSAVLQWDSSKGAVNYTAMASVQQVLQTSCSSADTSCVLRKFQCGQTYKIIVTAYNGVYQEGTMSVPITLDTEPCRPGSVTGHVVKDVGTVSWEPSVGAVSYVAVLEGERGDTLSCQTTQTSCDTSGLQCGSLYLIQVLAIGNNFNSSISNASLLTTVPCLVDPGSFTVAVQCESDLAIVGWALSDRVTSYQLTATGNTGTQKTCLTDINSCEISNLECGTSYNLSLTSINSAGSVSQDTGVTFQSRPCVPQHVDVNLDCGTHMATVTWEQRPDVLYYEATATFGSDGAVTLCNSSSNSCKFWGLKCGGQYSFSVRAYSAQCHSDVSSTTNITSDPCQPQNVSLSGSCESNSLQLNWPSAGGALFYTASTTGSLGFTSSFQTSTPAMLLDVPCGQSFSFTVVSHNEQCSSLPSSPARFTTAPCVPMSVQTYVECENSLGSVSWAGSDGAVYYTAVAQGQTFGSNHMCNSSDTTCTWSELSCGEVYTVWITAKNLQCNSAPSNSTTLHTAPCIPRIMNSSMDCTTRVASLTWQPSQAALSYLINAVNNFGHKVTLTTSDTSAQISELECGQQYYLTVTSLGQWCKSVPSGAAVLETDPCPPSAVSSIMDCYSNIATVSWMLSDAADHYTAIATSPDGAHGMCTSTNTNCSIASLQCGQTYNITVTASYLQCSSVLSTMTNLNTAPCVPVGISAVMNCINNEAQVSWNASQGALLYHVSAVSDGNNNSSCESSGGETQCVLQGLFCGVIYTVRVMAVRNDCSSLSSQPLEFRSAPCPPQNVTVQMSCSVGAMTVVWAANPDAEYFHVDAVGATGNILSCKNTGTNCSISGLTCGQSFSVTVTAVRAGCQSKASTAIQVSSAPCIPQNVTGNLDCITNSVWTSWQATAGADSFNVLAVKRGGASATCTTSDVSCSVPSLKCGAIYTFSVTAVNAWCSSSPSNTFQIQTGPCNMTGISAETECRSTTISVSWFTESSSSFHIASAVGHDLSYMECNSTDTSCLLTGARCGVLYTIMVSAGSDKCNGLRSPPYSISTAPCSPQAVSVTEQCDQNGVLISWASSSLADSYSLTAIAQDGDVRNCTSPTENCTLTNLHCGQVYTLTVSASAGNCVSPASDPLVFHTAPCVPEGLAVSFSCENNSAAVSWSASNGAVRYYVSAQTTQGDELYCATTQTSCSISPLQCGAVYNFSVWASDDTCNSSHSPSLQNKAAPCPPTSVTVRTSASEDATLVRVYWNTVTCSAVQYLTELSGVFGNDPLALVQFASYWTEMTYFEFLVPCDLYYSVTVKAGNQAVSGKPSSAVNGSTGSCPIPTVRRRRDVDTAAAAPNGVNEDALSVPDVRVIQEEDLTLHVEWDEVKGASSYTLIVQEGAQSGLSGLVSTVQGETWDLPDLKPGTRYCVILSANNADVQSTYSPPACITTGLRM